MEQEIAVLLENAGDLDGAAAAQGQLLDMAELSVDEVWHAGNVRRVAVVWMSVGYSEERFVPSCILVY
jgi:hypothetical protein